MPFLPLLFANWRLIAIGLAIAAVLGYVYHCRSVSKQLAQSIAAAEEQARANAKQVLRDLKNKERSDENYARNIARLDADLARLRRSPGVLPAAGSSPGSAERACFDRPQLDAALQRFVAGVTDLVGEGAKAIEGLDEAKQWAQER